MNRPKISVIVPTFNRAPLLAECLDSILAQTVQDFEIVAVDDGSRDETQSVLARYSPRVKAIFQENRGVSAARNAGIKEAGGDCLAFCDSDDLWLPEKLEVQLALFESDPGVAVCYTDEIWVRRGCRVNPKNRHCKLSGWIFEKCLELCIVSPSSVMMRRDFFDRVGSFDESFPACEDYDLWLRASLVYPFHFIARPLIIKRGGHEDQLSRKYWGMDRFRVAAICKCLKGDLAPDKYRMALEVLRQKCTILADGAEKRGRTGEAEEYREIIRLASQKYR